MAESKLSEVHRKFLAFLNQVEKTVEDNWITQNAKDATDDTVKLVREAFRFGFHAGASTMDKKRDQNTP